VSDDSERYNHDQRIRREAYATALNELGYIAMGSPCERAAARYPLRKLVPKLIPDPNGASGTWSYDGTMFFLFRGPTRSESVSGPAYTKERIRALAALLDDPWELVDDTSVGDLPEPPMLP